MPFDLSRLSDSPYANPRVLLGAAGACVLGLMVGAWLTPTWGPLPDPDPYASFTAQPPADPDPAGAETGASWLADQPPPAQAVWTRAAEVTLPQPADVAEAAPVIAQPVADVRPLPAQQRAAPEPRSDNGSPDVRQMLFDPAKEYADGPPPPPASDGAQSGFELEP